MLNNANYETEPMVIGELRGYYLGTENGREYYEAVDGRKFSFPSADITAVEFEHEQEKPTAKTEKKEVLKKPTKKPPKKDDGKKDKQ